MNIKNYELNNKRILAMFLLIISILCLALMVNISSGSVDFDLTDLKSFLLGKRSLTKTEYNILFKIRLPRICAASLFGAALSVSGFLLQSFFRNPIVGPSVLGITSGAKMFVALVILTNFALNIQTDSLVLLFLASMLGSLVTMLVVLFFSKRIKNSSSLVIVGIMIGYLASAVTNFLTTFADEYDIASLYQWSQGSFSGVNWDMIRLSILIIGPTIIACFFLSKPLYAFNLGETYSQSLGLNTKKFRALLIFLSSILTACVTAFAGPISFVGIAVPHIVRSLFKSSNPKILIPAICLTGSAFCLWSDYFARKLLAPMELNISVITSFIGAPIIIYFMARRKKHD